MDPPFSRGYSPLHGCLGWYQSGVVFELIELLKTNGVPYLALRLDRDRPADDPLQFGRSLGLPGSPAACLMADAAGRDAVLVLDQVDAIRWTAAHSSHAWDTCERIIAEALRSPNVRVVVVCRSFDVEDHPQIRAWKRRADATELRVGPLDDGLVNSVVAACGVSPATLDEAQRRVLRSPQGLYLWRSLHESSSGPPAFRTLADLMRAFWTLTRKRLKELRPGDYHGALDALVNYMDRQGTLSAPSSVVAAWIDEIGALVSLNVLSEAGGGRILFAHQSYLDHLTAERLLKEIHGGTGTVLGWLSGDDQSLFRRAQLRGRTTCFARPRKLL